MEDHTKINTLSRYATVFVFSLFAIAALLAFGYYALDITISLLFKKDIIEFNKGAMYMLGVGLGAGLLVIFMIHELSGREISKSYNKKATNFALISIGLIFVFPMITDYVVTLKVKSIDYVYCENLSYRWLHVQSKVYGITADACENVNANEIRGIGRGF
jgi:hypothetical protein